MFKKNVHYSQDLEAAILGVCMIESQAFGRIYGLVDADTFYFLSHSEVFKSMIFLYENSLPIDILTVTDQLKRKKSVDTLEKYETEYFLLKLTNDVVSSAHMEYHSYIIKQMWIDRELIKLTNAGTPTDTDTRNRIYELQTRLQNLNSTNAKNDWKDMSELMVGLYQHQEDIQKSGGMGITTGINYLDKSNGGFHPGQLIIIGARPSVGKSALVGQMALDMAAQKVKVGIISLEMNNNDIAGRLAAMDANIDFDIVYRGLYTDEAQKHRLFNRIANVTAHLPIYVSDKTEVNIYEIKSKAQKLKVQYGLDILIVDYLQLVDSTESFKNQTRENEVRKISRGFKVMTNEMGIPIIVVCQLNREVTKRKDKARYPQLSDLRESGSLEQDADVVIFLHRDSMMGIETNEDGFSTEREADLVVRKWRNGKANFIIPMDFDGPKMKFTERKGGKLIPVKIEIDTQGDQPF